MEAFIKLQRKMLDWEWYTDSNTKAVFIHCLLKANWKEGRFRGEVVPRGSFITSLQSLSDELNISVRSVRTALDHLISTGELTSKTYPNWRMITVIKYNEYQATDKLADNQLTSNRQATDKQLTTIEEYKNNKNKKNNKSVFKKPSLEEIREYIREKNYNVDAERFYNYYESNGWKVGRNPMKDWQATVRNWASKEKKPESSDNLLDDIERIYLKGGVK